MSDGKGIADQFKAPRFKEEPQMLVLTRKPGETIFIGPGEIPPEGITITVLGVGPVRAQIGIDAPRELNVDRGEVAERKRAEQQPVLSL